MRFAVFQQVDERPVSELSMYLTNACLDRPTVNSMCLLESDVKVLEMWNQPMKGLE